MKFRFLLIAAAIASLSLAACSDNSSNPTGPPAGAELNSGDIPDGQSFTHRFFTAGTYGYHCTRHTVMNGQVVVSDAATDTSVTVTIANSTATGFQPGSVTVKTGGKVVWNNSGGTTHTVTSH